MSIGNLPVLFPVLLPAGSIRRKNRDPDSPDYCRKMGGLGLCLIDEPADGYLEQIAMARCRSMDNERNDHVSDLGHLKTEAAGALEAIARTLRSADASPGEEDIARLLNDAETLITELKTAADAGVQKIESEYRGQVESVEQVIADHPLPSVLIAAGAGILMGMLLSGRR